MASKVFLIFKKVTGSYGYYRVVLMTTLELEEEKQRIVAARKAQQGLATYEKQEASPEPMKESCDVCGFTPAPHRHPKPEKHD